ncbi:MAG: heavy metal translocating P-type ATPase, partial [Desulforhopalus sp.]
MTTTNLGARITGMHCAACSTRIEKVVGNLAGVAHCSVNLATEKASIDFDPEVIDSKTIKDTIAGLGFGAEEAAGDDIPAAAGKETAKLLQAMKRRLLPSFFLALAIMYLSMGHMIGLTPPHFLRPSISPFWHTMVQFLLLLPVLYLNRNFYQNGIPALIRGGANMDSLIAIGTGAAVVYSTWNLVEITLGIDAIARANDLYFESAAMLLALVSLGKYLEAKSKVRTSDAISQLLELAPETTIQLDDNGQRRVPVDEIQVGDRLLIRPGDRIPVDGAILDGRSAVDESMLTGESMPVSKEVGDSLYGGTLNKNGALTMVAKKIGRDTVLSRIVKMVQDAQQARAPIASLADRVSLYFVPSIIVIATVAGLSWFFLGGADPSFSLRIFIAVLVIACPCAMGLATPTSIMVGTGRGAQLGVLVKGGDVLESAEKVTCVLFDKTGTLTAGRPAVIDLLPFAGYDESLLLSLAASAEKSSEHPLAEAVVEQAEQQGCAVSSPQSFRAIPGRGVEATVKHGERCYEVLFGNEALVLENSVEGLTPAVKERASKLSAEAKTVLFLAVDGTFAGLVVVADPLKDEASQTIQALEAMKVEVVMLSGDNEKTARAVA